MTRVSSAFRGGSATHDATALTIRQAAILLALLAQNQPISNNELRNRFGFTLVGDDRRHLNDLGLVGSEKIPGHGNVLFHELTDAGWNRASRELTPSAEFTRLSVPAGVFFAFAEGVARFLEREQRTIGEVLGAYAGLPDRRCAGSPETDLAGTGQPVAASAPKEPTASTEADRIENPASLETAIRAAYASLATDARDWVRLADVRPLLGSVDRRQVDRVLRQMARQPDVRVVPDEDQKSLTAADRAAAVRIGEHDNHLLLIGSV
ncbi:hypothetical protein [Candidatus Frankia alpina]|uniref:Uncharacterized protein n=1 Tax=Candidatus Frankia alpina TaxID=2699483 RepID=A0A4S5CTG5_9ACTN|nr:hypothetical protein [Candidatus Frankia alpina]THJ48293.1 hypothetical protein E7Y31_19315 [Candidatus Frankia alpina]